MLTVKGDSPACRGPRCGGRLRVVATAQDPALRRHSHSGSPSCARISIQSVANFSALRRRMPTRGPRSR